MINHPHFMLAGALLLIVHSSKAWFNPTLLPSFPLQQPTSPTSSYFTPVIPSPYAKRHSPVNSIALLAKKEERELVEDVTASKDEEEAKEVGNTDIMKGSKGYNCRGFGTSPRWDTRFKRVGVSDEYMRKIREAEEEVRKLDEEENKKTAKQKSTFGHSAQFTLFNSTSNTPGPGSYKPDKPPVRMSGNIKLGHKTAIPGGRGVDGEAVGDDDSFTTPGGFRINVGETCEAKDKSLGWRKCRVIRVTDEGKYDVEFKDGEVMQDVIKGLLREPLGRVLIGKSLVHNTGDKSIDSKMQEYRKAVDKRVLRGQLEEEVGIEDDLSVVSGLTMMNRTMFMSDETPRFVDYVGHMTVTPSLRAELNRRDEFAATLRKKKKKAPKNYDMSKTLDFIMGIKGLGEEEAELVREAREEATA
eukprot:CAMPEP_0118646900 /NCGR_PEP_ID=MMETSP0785-20121206/8315_1 /TAXON_ID=91992 /ORGANISM="Bolidomonas pacifica, Strain CCMP 1866" /LENGTH=413 /DNA_ID=CAMNT_0006538949 /DNA_START=16 /DNA_END=1258 /DNA_ORIENTATION=-